ncbi:MAG: hypothetical protein AAF434_03205 [Pseudomonadota bacterium]
MKARAFKKPINSNTLQTSMFRGLLIGVCSTTLIACGGSSSSSSSDDALNCEEQTIVWSEGANNCEAQIASAADGTSTTLQDLITPSVGTTAVSCAAGNWVAEAPMTCAAAPAGDMTKSIDLAADGSSRVYEYFSDTFAQIDQGFDGSETIDGYFQISMLPDFIQIGSGVDIFQFEGDWDDAAVITFNVDGLTGIGDEQAAITGLAGNFNTFVSGESTLLGIPYTTTFSDVTGTVNLTDGAVTSVDSVSSTLTLSWDTTVLPPPFDVLPDTLPFAGTFDIDDTGAFTMNVGDVGPDPSVALGQPAWEWNATGTVDASSFE